MKKVLSLSVFMVFLLTQVYAAGPVSPEKVMARKVLKKTAFIITKSTKAMQEKKVMTGNLSIAVSHQKLARKYYNKGMLNKAVIHSLRARKLALAVLTANNGKESQEYTDEEKKIALPSEEDTDKNLQVELPNEAGQDKDYMDMIPNLDVAD